MYNAYRQRFLSETERFWEKVRKTDGCWHWTGAALKARLSYGVFRFAGKNGKAHRYSYELHCGQIPTGLCVLHRCDNPRCVRPDHLWVGTPGDNNRDTAAKKRYADHRGERNRYHTLTDAQVRGIRALYAAGTASQRDVAARFGINQTTVSRICRRDGWRHVA